MGIIRIIRITLKHCDVRHLVYLSHKWIFFPSFQHNFLPHLLLKGSMFSVVVLVFGCLLQRKLVTTEGHHGTNRHVFYAVKMDRGVRGVRALAKQHGLEFIQQVSAFLNPCCHFLLWTFNSYFLNPHSVGLFMKAAVTADSCFPVDRYLAFIKLWLCLWIFLI